MALVVCGVLEELLAKTSIAGCRFRRLWSLISRSRLCNRPHSNCHCLFDRPKTDLFLSTATPLLRTRSCRTNWHSAALLLLAPSTDLPRPVAVTTAEVTWEHNDRRCTIVKCQACRSLLSRDRNAAHVIADIFLAVCGTTTSKTEPLWIRDDAVRETNKLNTTPRDACSAEKNITVTPCLSTKKNTSSDVELIFCCLNPRFNCTQNPYFFNSFQVNADA